ncbi:Down syndrome cell adhesion molecule [Oopsacas minuta]|uniref:Down syndrome cell adhesion molecule n=1 Tax=Oopsacas minuta TaxID=111878 RepID=A0AAV7KPU4_9METZ|nr:Down syndrome cell adhesion molecule [Oopsacas minuta]
MATNFVANRACRPGASPLDPSGAYSPPPDPQLDNYSSTSNSWIRHWLCDALVNSVAAIKISTADNSTDNNDLLYYPCIFISSSTCIMLLLLFLFSLIQLVSTSQVYLVFNDLSVASGQQATFSCNVNGATDHTINKVLITDPDNTTLQTDNQGSAYFASVLNSDYSDSGVYTCTVNVTNNIDSVTEIFMNTALLVVYLPAVVLQAPSGGIYFVDVQFSISCQVEGFPIPEITWLFDGTVLSGTQNITEMVSIPFITSVLTFLNPIEPQSGNYSCRCNNMYTLDDTEIMNEKNSSQASIIILSPPMVTSLEDRNVTILDMVTILCEASGQKPLTFTWYNVSDSVSSLTSNSEIAIENFSGSSELTIQSVTRKFTGIYQCAVSNIAGTASEQMLLLVQEKPFPPESYISEAQAESVTISWSIPFNGNSPITQVIFEMEVDGSYHQNDTVSGDFTMHTITSLIPYTDYEFRVRVENIIGVSSPSSPLMIRTLSAPPVSAPKNVALSDVTADSVKISWSPPDPPDWNGPITSFLIEYTLLLTTEEGGNIVKSVSNTLTIPLNTQQSDDIFDTHIQELESYQNYSLRASACTTGGCGLYSEAVYTFTLGSAPTAGPIIYNTEVTPDTILLQWNEIPLRHRNGIIISYTIVYSTDNEPDQIIRTGTNERELTITDLSSYTVYSVLIAGETIGIGPNSSAINVLTGETIPSEPLDIMVVYLSYTELSISWAAPISPNGNITHYTIYYTQPILEVISRSDTAISPPYIIRDLVEGFPVTITISAMTTAGEGPVSQEAVVQPAASPQIDPLTISNGNKTRQVIHIQVHVDNTLHLTCSIVGTPTPDYNWMSNYTGVGYFDLHVVEQNYTINKIIAEQDGAFMCVARNIFGSAYLIFIVTVVELPVVELDYGFPEFCIGNGEVTHCERGRTLTLTCSFMNGIPTPVLNFTREGQTVSQVVTTGSELQVDIVLSDENSRFYVCEAVNNLGKDRQSLFINLVGIFSIEVTQGVITWSLSDTGYLDGDFILEYGMQTISENSMIIQNLSPLMLGNILTVPGSYLWRLKFVTSYGDAVVSQIYSYELPSSPIIMDWLIGLLLFLVIIVIIIFVIVIILFILYCYRRRRHKNDYDGDLFFGPDSPVSKPVSLKEFGTSGPLDGKVDRITPIRRPKKQKQKKLNRESYKQSEEYTKNQAYRGPMAFHNRGLETDLQDKPKPSSFQAASNIKFLGHKQSHKEPVGATSFKRIDTPEFPIPPPPPIDNLFLQSANESNLTPPPPPVPDPTYSS